MATPMYPTDAAQTIGVVPSPSGWSSATFKKLSFSRGAGAVTKTINTLASLAVTTATTGNLSPVAVSALAGIQAFGTAEGSIGGDIIWISDPIAAVTLDVTNIMSVNMRALESNAMANYACACYFYKIDGVTGATTNIQGRAGLGTELGTVEAASSFGVAPITTAFADGDYIAVRFFYGSATATASASGFTASFFYAGAAGATGDTFVSFVETVTGAPAPATKRPAPKVVGQAVMGAATRCWTRRRSGIVVPRLWVPEGAVI